MSATPHEMADRRCGTQQIRQHNDICRVAESDCSTFAMNFRMLGNSSCLRSILILNDSQNIHTEATNFICNSLVICSRSSLGIIMSLSSLLNSSLKLERQRSVDISKSNITLTLTIGMRNRKNSTASSRLSGPQSTMGHLTPSWDQFMEPSYVNSEASIFRIR